MEKWNGKSSVHRRKAWKATCTWNDSLRVGQLSWVQEVEPDNPKKGETTNLHDQLVSQHHSFCNFEGSQERNHRMWCIIIEEVVGCPQHAQFYVDIAVLDG